jgi:hypothetical protein
METPKFLTDIDWKRLREQKKILVEMTFTHGKFTLEENVALDGIINLIDSLQDYAVDEMGISEKEVFDFDESEEKNVTVGIIGINTGLVDAHKNPIDEGDKVKTVYLCASCNSDYVHLKAIEDEMGWCEDCQKHNIIYTAQLKADCKIIGFQVINIHDGERHPAMLITESENVQSRNVFSLTQCRQIIKESTRPLEWQLLAVWTGDMENPILKFTGDPRS